MTPPCHIPVIPAEAGIHVAELNMDPRFRGDDGWGYQRFRGDDGWGYQRLRGDDGWGYQRFCGDDGWGYQRFRGDDGARGDDGTMTREEP